MDIKILVATHKRYKMPKNSMYIPLHVGKEGKKDLGYVGDNTGDNISLKNSNYCELTGLYWAYKNLNCEYIGLCHYRRYFTIKSLFTRLIKSGDKFDLLLNGSDVETLLSKYDLILPRKRNYYIETVESHYKNAHYVTDLRRVEEIIGEKYPEYLTSFNKVMSGTTLHLYNMFIMEKSNFNDYCKWLFDILFTLEDEMDLSQYDSYQSRVYGFLSERLFNVWIENQKLKYIEIPILNMEKINWFKKIESFLKRKFS